MAANKYFSEKVLLSALKSHDEHAIKYIYESYWPINLKLLKLNNGDEEDAKDLYQESMLDLLEKLWSEDFVLTCKISTYFYSICRNNWLYHTRSKKRFIEIEDDVMPENSNEEITEDEMKLPDDEEIKNAVMSLGDPCRSLLVGFYYDGLSMEQLALKLNYKSSKGAKQQKFRCKERLTQAISKLFKSNKL
jgi:RNA polymerase sigma factor (sigma-70 family)